MQRKNLKEDKKGFMGIVFFFLILFTILIIGFIAVIVVGAIDYTSEQITPVMKDLGMAGDTNLSEASEYTFGTVDTLVNALPWLLLFTYVAMLIFSLIFVVTYRLSPHPAYIGIYFMFCVLLIFGSILMSNMYQDIYLTRDPLTDKISSQTGMSSMMLHSPLILGAFAFIVGIYIFAVRNNNDAGGGFDI